MTEKQATVAGGITYINSRVDFENCAVLRFWDTDDFLRLVEVIRPSVIVVVASPYAIDAKGNSSVAYGKQTNEFRFWHQGLFYATAGQGFATIEELREGRASGFSDAAAFRIACERGFTSENDFREAKGRGFDTRAAAETAKLAGYWDCLPDAHALFGKQKSRTFPNAASVCQYGTKQGFTDFSELVAAHNAGFDDAAGYRAARDAGFEDASSYVAAREVKAASPAEWTEYQVLQEERRDHGVKTIQEADLLRTLSALEPGEQQDLRELWNTLRSKADKYPWYSSAFESEDDFRVYVARCSILGRIGSTAFTDGSFVRVENGILSKTTVIVDASNVAWSGQSQQAGGRARLSNLTLMLAALSKRGFDKVVVIADASLRHQIDNRVQYEPLIDEGKVRESPAATDADHFILRFAMENRCLIVSNDAFRDWRERDPWVDAHIEQHRVPYMILDDQVQFYEPK